MRKEPYFERVTSKLIKEDSILLGRNGVGRSTTCKAIAGEVEPKVPLSLMVMNYQKKSI